MRITNAKSGWEARYHCLKIKETPSTLLVPGSLSKRLDKTVKKEFSGCWRSYIHYLLNRHQQRARGATRFGISRKLKKQYQRAGQELTRRNFRPTNASWLLLGQLANARGMSACRMFVMLALYDLKKRRLTAHKRTHLQGSISNNSWPRQIKFYTGTSLAHDTVNRGIRLVQ